jgi:hypothetical protein
MIACRRSGQLLLGASGCDQGDVQIRAAKVIQCRNGVKIAGWLGKEVTHQEEFLLLDNSV